jgi:hypothetical protein
MLRTILIGTCMSVQGHFVAELPDGRMRVRVGDRFYVGRPVGLRSLSAS